VAVREVDAALLRLENIDHAAAVGIRLSRLLEPLHNSPNPVDTLASCIERAVFLDADQGAGVLLGARP
jgi:hypothetical protein